MRLMINMKMATMTQMMRETMRKMRILKMVKMNHLKILHENFHVFSKVMVCQICVAGFCRLPWIAYALLSWRDDKSGQTNEETYE